MQAPRFSVEDLIISHKNEEYNILTVLYDMIEGSILLFTWSTLLVEFQLFYLVRQFLTCSLNPS